MAGAGERIVFDFEGSLQLARMLWSLADDLRSEAAERERNATVASERWRGRYADDFGERMSTETSNRLEIAAQLRDDARNWAKAWQTALDQQNKINRINKVEEVSDSRNLVHKAWDATFGEDTSDSKVAPLPEVAVPTPPGFWPTATETVF